MRGSSGLACLAAALLIGHALLRPSADFPTVVSEPLQDLLAETLPGVSPPVEAPVSAETWRSDSWGTNRTSMSTAGSFAYPKIHAGTPLPALALAAIPSTGGWNADDSGAFEGLHDTPMDAGPMQRLSRGGLCSAIASVAQANDLPITFFANLIWQESSFQSRTISPAGALGIAQFIPETAIEYGLMNPFEPLHALFAAGKLLRKLNDRFGNLGLAAAAYNAGPQRVNAWMAERRTLPGETRAYVIRITGRAADRWLSSEIRHDPEATLMPAKAPCAEVEEDVRAQARIVRVSKLMSELAAATAAPSRVVDDIPLPRKNMRKLQQREVASAARIQSAVAATPRQPTTSLACARIPCR
jgi:hypothetical protein